MVVSVCHAQISLKTLSVSWIETHQTFFFLTKILTQWPVIRVMKKEKIFAA